MLWLIFSLSALFLWAIVNILDKHVLSTELKDPRLSTAVVGLVTYGLFFVLSIFYGDFKITNSALMAVVLTGALVYPLAIWLYYYVMRKMEVSRFVPILSLEPLLIAVLVFTFLGERLNEMTYGAIVVMVLGAILVSWKRGRKHGALLTFIGVLAMALFSLRNVLLDYAFIGNGYWAVMFWFSLSGFIACLILFAFSYRHLHGEPAEGARHLVLSGFLSALGLLAFAKAMTLGSVTLSTAILSTKPLLVFLMVTILSFVSPRFVRESHDRKQILQKFIGTVLILLGSVFMLIWK